MTARNIIILFILSLLSYTTLCQKFSVDGRYINNNDKPFTALGVNYSPVPIGGSQALLETDRGDVFSNDWTFIHERDIPLMREMGINTIRVYNFFPWKFPTIATPEWSSSYDNDHSTFLDMLWNDGEDPIYIWISFQVPVCFHYVTSSTRPSEGVSWRLQNGQWASVDKKADVEDAMTRKYVENSYIKLAEKYGNHPTVIGFVIGNEQNDEITRSSPVYWAWINSVAKMIKENSEDKLTMISIVDDGSLTVRAAESLGLLRDVDVWGINSYRGTVDVGFDTLFTEYASYSNKPLLVTEYGPPASTRDDDDEAVVLPNNAQSQADYIKVHFDDIVAHRSICSGAYIFEWSDEWWKSVDPTKQDPSDAPNGAYPGGHGDEEYFGIHAIQMISEDANTSDYRTRGADELLPRAAVETVTLMYNAFDHDDIPDQEALIPIAPYQEEPPFNSSPSPNAPPRGNPAQGEPDDVSTGGASQISLMKFVMVFSLFFIWAF